MRTRNEELNKLQKDFLKPKATLSFVFGRKKIGKTTFINRYTNDKNTLFLPAYETLGFILRDRLLANINSFFKTRYSNKSLKNFEDIFLIISQQNIQSKIVIVFEELHLMQKQNKTFLKKFMTIWNKHLKHKNIQFIFTSSFYSSKKEDALLYKKADNLVTLKAFSHNMITQILPNLEKKDFLGVYTVYGTNPNYLSLYNTNKSFYENIKKDLLNPSNMLFTQALDILKSDLNDIATYSAILYAIAKGNKKIGDIAGFLNLKSTYLTRYIQNLVDLMILNKEIPLNTNEKKNKFGRYEIEDNYMKFWFSYIYVNSTPNKNDYNLILNYIRKDLNERLLYEAYKKHSFELISEGKQKFLGYIPNQVGKWWNNKGNEIDLVAFDNENVTFIDCVLKGKDNLDLHYKKLQEKAEGFETTLNKKYAIFTQ